MISHSARPIGHSEKVSAKKGRFCMPTGSLIFDIARHSDWLEATDKPGRQIYCRLNTLSRIRNKCRNNARYVCSPLMRRERRQHSKRLRSTSICSFLPLWYCGIQVFRVCFDVPRSWTRCKSKVLERRSPCTCLEFVIALENLDVSFFGSKNTLRVNYYSLTNVITLSRFDTTRNAEHTN